MRSVTARAMKLLQSLAVAAWIIQFLLPSDGEGMGSRVCAKDKLHYLPLL